MSRSMLSHFVALSIFMAAAFGLYGVKYQVQEVHQKVQTTQRALLEERKALQVAAAEWAYLSRPERLASLSEKYLTAEPMVAQRVNEVTNLPSRPAVQYVSAQQNMAPHASIVSVSARADETRLMTEE